MRWRSPTISIRAGQAKRALVIGAETFSRILDWQDRGTCVLFGDGAGAVVLRGGADGSGARRARRALDPSPFRRRGYDLLYVDGGPSSTRTSGKLRMEGSEVFRHAVTRLAEVVDEALAANGLAAADDRLAGAAPGQPPHHRRHGEASSASAPTGSSSTIERHANTSAASVPLALAEAVGRRADPAGPAGAARGDGRRLDLGRRAWCAGSRPAEPEVKTSTQTLCN